MEIKSDTDLDMTAREFGNGFTSDVIGGAIVAAGTGSEWEWFYMRKNGDDRYEENLILPGDLSIRMAKFIILQWFEGYDCGLQEGEAMGKAEAKHKMQMALGRI
ncbi:MAG: hypothetical protein AB7D39_17540 [Pseudodesulfovibrio sp.]|jgi:hypothetical protein|uniref:hypothetical protein n=1 Tax=Pseudodesulfovibrio sp. TaxID=2035812 RepID=UPI003D1303B5